MYITRSLVACNAALFVVRMEYTYTIRAWLGHVSIDTTNIYAETDLEMKAKALATCEVKETKRSRRWKEDKGLMTFLRAPLSLELMWRSVRWFVAESWLEKLSAT